MLHPVVSMQAKPLRVAIPSDKFDCTLALAFAIKVWSNYAYITDNS